ncbi:MAG: glycosyltransferase family 2 protein [Desulfomicrobium sp.]|nr:glycosyltransferase family 2 protein [Pseudomonadota bacterium]MBV1711121.1 glycosyltransferase family 2 protein [Desulfomicrobium sp.]MBU4569792.1 glycosyltransferase family 2 protein [Pseudomonadota bacterium]MBU4595515.1 glycosyltransferase family 2 protein [Pseudomonadota bacterium]MBV1718984.1 glycosyltransferase family 2 protein [Desulfomicrobium sp.]
MTYVSVIIPTHNRAEVLGRAIASVLGQTWTDLELIVVDDGSTDATAKVLAEFDDPRLTGMHQENKGVSSARNRGIAASRGRLIALLDSDDYWMPDKLEKQVRFMAESGFAICQTDEIWIRNGQRVNPRFKHVKPAGWFLERSLELCLISPSCVMFTRALWNELGPFDERLPACEDYSLWLRVGVRYPVGLVPEALVVKTGGHADQLSRRIIGLDLYRVYAMLDLLRHFELTAEQRRSVVAALAERVRLYAQGCIKHGKDEEAVRVRELAAEFLRGF